MTTKELGFVAPGKDLTNVYETVQRCRSNRSQKAEIVQRKVIELVFRRKRGLKQALSQNRER